METKIIIFGAFYVVHEYRVTLAKALLFPFCAYLAIVVGSYLEVPGLVSWLLAALAWVPYAIIAITTHRVVLLGPGSVPEWGMASWSKRETYFILHVLGLGLIAVAISFLGFIPFIGVIVALVAICWLLPRLSLVFPGIAVDKGVSFKLSWEMTESCQLHMFLIVIIFPMLLGIPALVFELVPYGSFFTNIYAAFVIVFEVAALSLTYQKITSELYGQG